MAIAWTILHELRLVRAMISGDQTTPDDFEKFFISVNAQGARPYRKCVDISFAPLDVRLAGLKAIGAVAAKYAEGEVPGPLAVIVSSELSIEMTGLFEKFSNINRPVKMFQRTADAMQWLDQTSPIVSAGDQLPR